MKVVEIRKDERTGAEVEVSWGNVIDNDLTIMTSVANILTMRREQDTARLDPGHNPVLDRFTTIAIHIEL